MGSRSSALRYSLYILLSLVLALIVSIATLPWWLPTALHTWGESHGILLERLEIEHPGWRRWRIPHLKLQHHTAQGHQTLTAERIEMTYHWRDLLQGKFHQLTIPAASLAWQDRPSPPNRTDTSPLDKVLSSSTAALLLPQEWLSYVPIKQFALQQLLLEPPPRQPLLTGSLKAEGNIDSAGLEFSLQWRQPERQHVIEGVLTADNHVSLQLATNGARWLTLKQTAQPNREMLQLQGQLSAELQELPRLASSFNLPLAHRLKHPSGNARLDWELYWPVSRKRSWQQMEASVNFRLQAQAAAVGRYAGQTDLFLQGSTHLDHGKLTWRLGNSSYLASVPLLERLPLQPAQRQQLQPYQDQPVTLQLPADLTGSWQVGAPYHQWQGVLTLAAGMQPEPLMRSRLQLVDLLWPLAADGTARGSLQWSGELDARSLPQLPISLANWNLFIDGQYKEQLALQVSRESLLELIQLHTGQLQLPSLAIRPYQPLQLNYLPRSQQLRLETATELGIAMPQLNWQSYRFDSDEIRLQLSDADLDLIDGQWQGHGQWQIATLQASAARHRLLPLQLDGRFSASHKQLEIYAYLQGLSHAINLNLSLQHELSTGRGEASLTLPPLAFAPDQLQLSQLLHDWPYAFDITKGQLSGTGTFRWQTQPNVQWQQQQLRLELDHLDGVYGNNGFTGLQGRLDFASVTPLNSDGLQRIQVALLNTGVPIRQIELLVGFEQLASPTPRIHIERLDSRLLGGRAWTRDIKLDLSRADNRFKLNLEGLELAKALALEQQEGLSGSGTLDGLLPFRLSEQGLSMTDGILKGRAPGGFIRYQPDTAAQRIARNNPQLHTAFAALKNFRYRVLNVEVDYAPDGTLQLQLKLQGRNPEFQQGRPIHFNLTIEENIPALLQSLRMAGEIGERIGKGYRAR